MNIFLFIGAIFITTLFLGRYLEKIRVPWVFAALVMGTGLAMYNPFSSVIESETFETFAELGMYFLLFLIGFELNTVQLKKKTGFIFKSAFFIIFLEGLFGSLVVHFIFGYDWFISLLVAMSFATVGEAILVPILQEFKLINTSLGQSIIGIGTADDIVEILLLLVAGVLVGTQTSQNSIFLIIGSFALLILLTTSFAFIRGKRERFRFISIETLFLFVLFVFFIFVGLGSYAGAAPLGAIVAGITVRMFIRKERLEFVENELKSLTYGFFAPLFFVWAGATLDMRYLITSPLLVLLVAGVSITAKLFGSYIVGRKRLGIKGSIMMGVGLSVRFSTSIVIIKFLFDSDIIGSDIYSVVVASSIIFMFIVPVLFSLLATRWGFAPRLSQ